MKVLNLFAGVGGNREPWSGHEITAVEFDPRIAAVYQSRFPADTVVAGDAIEYLQEHYREFDFIWASPPCPSHGQYRHNVGVLGKGYAPLVPDMTSLYGIIIFLRTYYTGLWCVENVRPYYAPPLKPSFEMQRHLFWANFWVPRPVKQIAASGIGHKNSILDFADSGIVAGSGIKNKRQVLRNRVDPEIGKHIMMWAEAAELGLGATRDI